MQISSVDDIPPYGFTDAFFSGSAGKAPKRLNPTTYAAWVKALADELAENIWPQFDMGSGNWAGASRTSAVALTEVDLKLCSQLAQHLFMPVAGASAATQPVLHQEFYAEEDGFVIDPGAKPPERPYLRWGASFYKYDLAMPLPLCETLSKDFDDEGFMEAGGLIADLKAFMRRPRPYQMALMLGYAAFRYQYAHTSPTPALVSGHALRSLISGCYVFQKHQFNILGSAGVADAWAQFMVDVGDRRVFAGVHYPSDSMASWFCGLRVVRIFYGRDIRDFLWLAIRDRSRVYLEVEEHARTHADSPYAAILRWLAAEAAA